MDILENFSLTKPYRFCMYLSSVILVSSFVVQPLDIDVNHLRKACFSLIAWGIIFWIAENFCYYYLRILEDDDYMEIDHRSVIKRHMIINTGLNAIYLVIALLIVGSHF